MKSKNSVIFWAIFCCLLWSSAFVGIKIGLHYSEPLRFAGIRFMLAGLLTVPFCYDLKNYFNYVKKSWKFLLFIAFLQTALHYSLFYLGLIRVEGALAAIVVGSSPLFVAITSHFIMANDKMSWAKALTIVAGVSGVTLVALGRSLGQENANVQLLGVLLLLITNIAGSFNNILVAKEKNNIPPLVISSFSMFVGGLIIFLFSIPMEGVIDFVPRPREYYVALAWLTFVSAAGVSIWTKLLKIPGIVISELNFWKFLIPVSGAILAWALLPDENPNWITVIGILIIGSSLMLLNLYNRGMFGKNKISR